MSEIEVGRDNAGTYGGQWLCTNDRRLMRESPIDGELLGTVALTTDAEYETVLSAAQRTLRTWRMVPAPQRAEVVREIGVELRRRKRELAELITLESGKILSEAEGEVQEAIDMSDFAVGLSRRLCGSVMQSERPQHRMYEHWEPLGAVAVITAFNFPLAVWAWNAFIAAVCGDVIVWKPSERGVLTAVAVTKICETAAARHDAASIFSLMTGEGSALGRKMAADSRFPLVSATGSCAMGRDVAQLVAGRLGRTLLELGGNNAVIVLKDANLDLAARAVFFGAVGTAGQRCTSTRRVLVEEAAREPFLEKLIALYRRVKIGNPLEPDTLVGPLISRQAVSNFQSALERVPSEGGKLVYGGQALEGYASRNFVTPAIVAAHRRMPLVREETFGPILYVIPVSGLEEAIEANNEVPQGLSSAIFTDNIRASERFLSAAGSDCGLANVNIGTSGAEIGGAFGGEKDTGGGREAGSDAWKSYMRRQTTTINWSEELPLAQGVKFEV